MSPTYTAPAIETIHQGEQLSTVDSHHEPFTGLGLDGPRERARPSSSRSDTYGRKHRSGSPQVHPYLKASPVAEDARRASNIPVPKASLRRHASADFSLLRVPCTGLTGVGRLGTHADGTNEIREQKRVRLSSSPKRPTPLRSLSYHAPDAQPERSSGSKPTVLVSFQATQPGVQGISTGSPAEALRYLEGNPRSTSADRVTATDGRSSWSGHDGKILSPSPRSSSPASSLSSSPHSVASSHTTVDTEISTINHADLDGQETPVGPVAGNARTSPSHRRQSADPDRYGTPEMPRGPAKLPHIPTNDLTTPRLPNQSHPKHLPRAEKLPMSGYELLASTISSSAAAPAAAPARTRMSAFLDTSPSSSAVRGRVVSRRHSSASASFFNSSSQFVTVAAPDEEEQPLPVVKPIYRRFEALNHRLLLHLQDELSELEEQLHRLDTTDTQTRRLQSSILPASRRAEFLVGGELQWHKTDILSKITYKLSQYNHALTSFTSTRDLPAPTLAAVTEYRDYLATHRPISDVETRFLDSTDDLVTLETPATTAAASSTPAHSDDAAQPPASGDYLHSLRLAVPPPPPDEPIVTPIPGTMHGNSWLVRHKRVSSGGSGSGSGSGSGGSHGSSSATSSSSSPRFARPNLGLEPLVSPRLPPSPLRQQQQQNHHGRSVSVPAVTSENKPQTVERAHALMAAQVVLALAVAVLVPILGFAIVPGFVERIVVVVVALMMGVSVVGSRTQAEDLKRAVVESRAELAYSGALYAGVMAVVAGVMA